MRLTRRRLVEEASAAKRLRPSKTVLTDQPMQENKMARPGSMHDAHKHTSTRQRGEAVRCGARCGEGAREVSAALGVPLRAGA